MKATLRTVVTCALATAGTWVALLAVGLHPSAWQILTLSGLVSMLCVPWKLERATRPNPEKRVTLTPEALLAARPLTIEEQRELATRLREAQKRIEAMQRRVHVETTL